MKPISLIKRGLWWVSFFEVYKNPILLSYLPFGTTKSLSIGKGRKNKPRESGGEGGEKRINPRWMGMDSLGLCLNLNTKLAM